MTTKDGTETSNVRRLDGLSPARLEAANAVVERLSGAYPAHAKNSLREIREIFSGRMNVEKKDMKFALHRFAHNLEGQGTSFHYPLISEIAESFGRFLQAQEAHADLGCTVVERYFDAIEEVLDRKLAGDCGREGAAIMKSLGDPTA